MKVPWPNICVQGESKNKSPENIGRSFVRVPTALCRTFCALLALRFVIKCANLGR